MKIGFYFDSRHLGKWTWSEFLAGELALSGTDSQILLMMSQLSKNGYDVNFFSTASDDHLRWLSQIVVDSLENAADLSKGMGADVLILTNRANQDTITGLRRCEQVDQPCIVWDQNGPDPEMADLLFALTCVRRVICVSAIQADDHRDNPVFEKIEVIHNAIINNFSSIDESVTRNPLGVCYLGALVPAKGFHRLARVWPEVRKKFPEANLTVIGSAHLYNRYEPLGPLGVSYPEYEYSEIIPYLGSSREEAERNGVTFVGLMPPNTIKKILLSKSIGVMNPMCSSETFGISGLEIQRCGAALIGGDGGGTREASQDGNTGILVKSDGELYEALTGLLASPETARKMGKNGSKWVKNNFSPDLIMKKWCLLLNAVQNHEKPHNPPFSWKRATPRVVLRECIRQARKIPFLRGRLPTLYNLNCMIKKYGIFSK